MTDSAAPSPGRIFISYRREETAYPAGWLYDRLADRFGGGQVFKDIDSIQLGDDFVDVITRAVASCDVLLAMIGDRWVTIADDDGKRRLDDPADFVRLEIEAALKRNVRVIPILVDGASMPRAAELPRSLAKLVRRHALELSPARFDFDTGRLLKVLDTTVAEVRAAEQRAREQAAEEAAEQRAREQAAQEAAQERAREQAAQEAAQERAREQAAQEAAQERAREQAAQEAAQERTREQAAQEAAQERAREQAAQEAAEQRAREQAAQKAAQERAREQAAQKAAQERAREQAAQAAAQERAREQAAQAAAQERAREQAAQAAAQGRAREQAAQEAAQERAREQAAQAAAQERAREQAAQAAAQEQAASLRVARDRVDRAEELLRRQEYKRALAACAEVLKEFGNSSDPALLADMERARGLAKQARSELLRRWWRRAGVVGIAAGVAVGIYLLWQAIGPDSEAKKVEIPARQAWTDAGVDCKPGRVLEIAATGTIYHTDSARRVPVGPDGNPRLNLRNYNVDGLLDVNHAALIGSIDRQQPYFPVGGKKTYTCSAGGRLFLGINDTGLDDNAGKFIATIKQRS